MDGSATGFKAEISNKKNLFAEHPMPPLQGRRKEDDRKTMFPEAATPLFIRDRLQGVLGTFSKTGGWGSRNDFFKIEARKPWTLPIGVKET